MMETTELRQQLCGAIARRSLVMFEYGDLIRVVEPHRFGINSAGHEMLSGWLRAGYSRSDPAGGWRNYLLSDVSALQVLDAPFAGTRPGYVAQDPRMREVFCQLTPSAADAQVEGPYVVREPTPPRPAGPSAPNAGSRSEPGTEAGPESSADARADSNAESSIPSPMQSPAHEPVRSPVEAARTRDGEIDPPEAVQ
jgi:hypothetical protein